MVSKKRSLSGRISSARIWLQAAATFFSNPFLTNIPVGRLYTGSLKKVCLPGLNCYSCPAASGACPIGALQAVSGSSRFSFSFYVTGLLVLMGVFLGRFICGFLCPFGWFQELLHKVPSRKLSTEKLKPLRYFKYVILLAAVFLLPAVIANAAGLGDPYFCKYICPQGVLEGAVPLALADSSIRAALGRLFTWKASILLMVIILSIIFYRPFCKWLCPLGAFYALFNRISLLSINVDRDKCVSCGICADVCDMDVDVTKAPDHNECIRCGVCIRNCPADAISYRYSLKPGHDNLQAQTSKGNKYKCSSTRTQKGGNTNENPKITDRDDDTHHGCMHCSMLKRRHIRRL